MKQFLALLLAGSIYSGSIAQNALDEPLKVKYDMNLGIYIDHVLDQGKSAFKAGKEFGVRLPVLRATNSDLDLDNLPPNQVIRIPLFVNKIQSEGSGGRQLVYEVKKQETLYTIAKVYFKREVQELKRWNSLQNNALSVGQNLLVGYLHFPSTTSMASSVILKDEVSGQSISQVQKIEPTAIEGESQDQQASLSSHHALTETGGEKIGTVEEEKSILDIIDLISDTTSSLIKESDGFVKQEEEPVIRKVEEGVAFTEQLELAGNDMFVLHPKAKVNSKMTLIYPMLNTSVEAVVIGVLPKHLYPSNISVVISPSVAVRLSAKDKQFKVKMSYEEDLNVDSKLYSSLSED